MDETELVRRKQGGLLFFELGQVVATPGALAALERLEVNAADLLRRHARGDWGQVPPEDAVANDQSLIDGLRVLSSYPMTDGTRIWVITEADRSVTTLLLPEEY